MSTSTAPIAVIVGASSKHDHPDGKVADDLPASVRFGLGGALAMHFATKGFNVVLTARRAEVLDLVSAECKKIQQELAAKDGTDSGGAPLDSLPVSMDLTKDESVEGAFAKIRSHFPSAHIDVLVFNAGTPFPPGFSFGADALLPHELDVSYMNEAHDTQVGGLIRCTKHCLPSMLERAKENRCAQSCAVLISGATMQLRGGAKFGALAPGKTALRSLSQSMYQAYGPLGVHVCNVNIDGVVDSPATRNWVGGDLSKLMPPDEIAEQFFACYKQPPSCWSYEVQLTPSFSSQSVGMRM